MKVENVIPYSCDLGFHILLYAHGLRVFQILIYYMSFIAAAYGFIDFEDRRDAQVVIFY